MRRPEIGPVLAENAVELLRLLEPAKRAREWLRRELMSWGVSSPTIGDVEVVATELIANAALHAPPVYSLRMALTERFVLVEVSDGSPLTPRVLLHDVSSESGRGMLMVGRLTLSWGSEVLGEATVEGQPSKVVWGVVTRVHPTASAV